MISINEIEKLEKENSRERAINICSKGEYFKLKKQYSDISKKIKKYPENKILKSEQDRLSKVINNIEVYVQYSEKSRYPLSIKNYKNGYMTSKLYDTTQIGTYTISNIDSTLNSDYTNYYVRGYRQDEMNGVFTQWYPINLHGDNHIFEGYQYFQFRIEITNDTVEGEVNSIELEVL